MESNRGVGGGDESISIEAAADIDTADTNGGYHHTGNNMAPSHVGRRFQLYVGNLTWWTTDQDITDTVQDIGVKDFQEVKFFENRSNGQSKGFCVISLGSENSMRMCMDRLSKKELNGQTPVVTLPTKQALNQFESQQKTRPVPPTQNGPRPPPPNMGGPPQHQGPPPGHQPRMMNPNMPPAHMRPMHPNMGGQPPQHMQQGMGQGPPRMQGPPMHQGGPPMQQGPPRFQNQQWNGPPRPNGPGIRPGMPPQGVPPQRPQMVSHDYITKRFFNNLFPYFVKFFSFKGRRVECHAGHVQTGTDPQCIRSNSDKRHLGRLRFHHICKGLHGVLHHSRWVDLLVQIMVPLKVLHRT